MKLSRIHAYEIVPQKKIAVPADPPGGLFVPTPSIESTLANLVTTAKLEDQAMVSFQSSATTSGVASNPVRDQFLRFCFGTTPQSDKAGLELARRLSVAMDERSKSLLLFIASYKDGSKRRATVWVFPSDEAFQFAAKSTTTTVSLLTDIFNKSSRLRKAALFEGNKSATSFWDGRVIDLQSSKGDGDPANYWIESFLDCRLALEGKTGTRHLVAYLKTAYDNAIPSDREQFYSAMVAVRTDPKPRFSYLDFAKRYLTSTANTEFLSHVPDDQKSLKFDFDRQTFESKLSFVVFELTKNIWVSSPFDEIGQSVEVIEDGQERRVRVDAEIVRQAVRSRHA
ncbi:hypothetical protein [Rhodopirellula europaea]|uniref:hypothetical protein n=1 Tax=Rhodopirellula europaea TaxID=1263866 RepID=UPI0030EC2D05|tara:strand:+ start:120 stop:1139 length:1020 start_codon:yes stop_codon:yes gene_type:complete